MEIIREFLKKNVANIAIGLGIIGIITHFIIGLTKPSKLTSIFSVISFRDPFKNILSHLHISSNFNFLSILFLVMLIVGGYHYKKSKRKDSRLLKFGFSILAIKSLTLRT